VASRETDQSQSPPLNSIAKVVRVPRIPPQPSIEYSHFVAGVASKSCELPVADRLEQKSRQPQPRTYSIKKREGFGLAGVDRREQRQGHTDCGESLKPEERKKARDREL
jgi:hypothetical protein